MDDKEIEKLTEEQASQTVDFIAFISWTDPLDATIKENHLKAWFIKCLAKNMYTNEEVISIASILDQTTEMEFLRQYKS